MRRILVGHFKSSFYLPYKICYASLDGELDCHDVDVSEIFAAAAPGVLLSQHVWLPTNIRCAAHTLNLLATTDVAAILQANPDYAAKYNQAITKITSVWKACNRSTLASDRCYETIGTIN